MNVSAAYEGEQFDNEIAKAHARYYDVVRAVAPWMSIQRESTAAEAWANLQERRRDPAHMAWVANEQKLLDDRAAKYKEAVEKQMKMMEEARNWEQRRREELKRPIGKRYARKRRR